MGTWTDGAHYLGRMLLAKDKFPLPRVSTGCLGDSSYHGRVCQGVFNSPRPVHISEYVQLVVAPPKGTQRIP